MADNFDKFIPDWVIGTLTLTAGSKNFTATNAQLSLAPVRQGDTIMTPGGLVLPIESINENGNGGVLAQNAPAGAAGTYATRIRFQSDNSRFTGTLAALLSAMSGGNLQAFAKLAGTLDMVLIFTGPGTLGLINKSELGLQDPLGSLGKLADLSSVANVEQLANLSLDANKTLATNADKELIQVPTVPIHQLLLASGSLTASTTMLLPTGYNSFRLSVTDLNYSDGTAPFYVQFSTDGGATWIVGASAYTEQTMVGAGTTTVAEQISAAACRMLLGSSLNSAQRGFVLSDIDPGSASQFPSLITRSKYLNSANAIRMAVVASHRATAGRINAIRVFPGAGSVITGTYRLYGML